MSEDTILTAAHCFEEMLTPDKAKKENTFRVFVRHNQTVEIPKDGFIVYDEMAKRVLETKASSP